MTSDNPAPAIPEKESNPEKPPVDKVPEVGVNLSPDLKKSVKEELQFLTMIDLIAKEPLAIIYQDKILANYHKTVFEPVLEENQNLKQEFEDKNIDETIHELKSIAEEVACKYGVKAPLAKKIN